ncbi:MAG: MFS transporter [Hyphomicrobiaceae bacterium]|nr:MFS transporter [Hyphomicrobiaceae bacterium]
MSYGARRRLAHRLPFFYGWVIVAVAFVTLGLGANARTAFSLLFPPILKEFGWDRAMTASVFSAGFISSALYAPLVGYALDRFGPQRVMPFGAALVAAGLVLTTYATQPWHFYLSLGGLVVGASSLLAYNAHFVFLPSWFERRRGLALGVACAGVGATSILLFPWFQATIDGIGWRAGCLTLAALMIGLVLPLNLAFPLRRPGDIGLPPDGRAPAHDAASATAASATPPARQWTWRSAVLTPAFWYVSGACAMGLFAWYGILVHQTKYLLDLGFGSRLAAYALGLVPLFAVTGQIGLGHLSDRIGRGWVWTLSMTGFALCYGLLLVLPLWPSPALVFLMVAVQGALGYSLAVVFGAVPSELFPGADYGRIFGTIALLATVGASSSPWLFGWLHDKTGNYVLAFLTAIAASILSALLVWLAIRDGERRNRAATMATRPPPASHT